MRIWISQTEVRKMPLPDPVKDEEKNKFLSRCMGDRTMVSDFPKIQQRYAVCNSLWEKKGSD